MRAQKQEPGPRRVMCGKTLLEPEEDTGRGVTKEG